MGQVGQSRNAGDCELALCSGTCEESLVLCRAECDPERAEGRDQRTPAVTEYRQCQTGRRQKRCIHADMQQRLRGT